MKNDANQMKVWDLENVTENLYIWIFCRGNHSRDFYVGVVRKKFPIQMIQMPNKMMHGISIKKTL